MKRISDNIEFSAWLLVQKLMCVLFFCELQLNMQLNALSPLKQTKNRGYENTLQYPEHMWIDKWPLLSIREAGESEVYNHTAFSYGTNSQ